MSDPADAPTTRRETERERLRTSLAEWNLDGPHEIGIGELFGPAYAYAICLTCGATVMLNDLEELVEGMWSERGVRLHTGWHTASDDAS